MLTAFTPIDVGTIDLDYAKLDRWYEENTEPMGSTLADGKASALTIIPVREYTDDFEFTDPIDLYHRKYFYELNWKWRDDFIQEFPEVDEFVNRLPFKKITIGFLLGKHKKLLTLHQDSSEYYMGRHNVPIEDFDSIYFEREWGQTRRKEQPISEYRIVLRPDNHEGPMSFFMKPSKGEVAEYGTETEDHSNIDYCRMPSDASAFGLTQRWVMHGSDPCDKILLTISGELDLEAHDELVARSIKKYDEYVLRYDL